MTIYSDISDSSSGLTGFHKSCIGNWQYRHVIRRTLVMEKPDDIFLSKREKEEDRDRDRKIDKDLID